MMGWGVLLDCPSRSHHALLTCRFIHGSLNTDEMPPIALPSLTSKCALHTPKPRWLTQRKNSQYKKTLKYFFVIWYIFYFLFMFKSFQVCFFAFFLLPPFTLSEPSGFLYLLALMYNEVLNLG